MRNDSSRSQWQGSAETQPRQRRQEPTASRIVTNSQVHKLPDAGRQCYAGINTTSTTWSTKCILTQTPPAVGDCSIQQTSFKRKVIIKKRYCNKIRITDYILNTASHLSHNIDQKLTDFRLQFYFFIFIHFF